MRLTFARPILAILAAVAVCPALAAQTEASFPSKDGGVVFADLYGTGEKVARPGKLILLDGSAHAQFLFRTPQSGRIMRDILRFLAGK